MKTRTKAETEAIRLTIVSMVKQRPMTSAEIADALGVHGGSLGNYFTYLLRTGEISRHQWRKGQYRYYPGQTAPDAPYKPAPSSRKAEPPQRKYRVPVKFVDVSREYFGEPKPIRIALPAAPWEVAA